MEFIVSCGVGYVCFSGVNFFFLIDGIIGYICLMGVYCSVGFG